MEKFLIRYKLIRKFHLLLILNNLVSFSKLCLISQSKKLHFFMNNIIVTSFKHKLNVISELINSDFIIMSLKRFIISFLFINLSLYKYLNI